MEHKHFKRKLLNSIFCNFNWILFFLVLGFSISSKAQCAPPTNFRIIERTLDSATITWDAPANSEIVDGYDYRVTTVQQPNLSFPDFTTTRSITGYSFGPGDDIWFYIRTSCLDGSASSHIVFSVNTLLPNSGCQTTPYGLYPTDIFTPTFSSTPDVIATDAYAGQYSKVNVMDNREYIFNSSVASDYITITDDSGFYILAHGPAPLTWISDSDMVINYHLNTNASCSVQEVARTKTIKGQGISGCENFITQPYVRSIESESALLSWGNGGSNIDLQYILSTIQLTPNANTIPTGSNNGPDDTYYVKRVTGLLPNTTYYYWIRRSCDFDLWGEWLSGGSFTTQASDYLGCSSSTGQDLTTTFVPICSGNQEIISTSIRAGEFNKVQIQKNKIYTFSSSVPTDFITIRIDDNVIASGMTPLVWSSGDNAGDNTGVCTFAINKNNCFTELVTRTQSIKCIDASTTCDAPNALKINSITSTFANLSFVGANHIPSNGYQYYVSTSSTPPTTNTSATGSTFITNLFITNLNANTTYYIWVRSNCGSSRSIWVFGNSFSTVGASTSGCTSAPNGVLPATTFTPGCLGNTETILTNASTGQYTNVTLTPNTRYTFNPTASLGPGISTYITITNADASQVYVVGTPPLVWDSGSNSGIMRFYVHINNTCEINSNLRLKAISCTPTPNCTPPSALTSSSVTINSATVSWTAPNPLPVGYVYYINTSNIAPTTNTVPTGGTIGTSVVLNGLNPTTQYYVWVRSICGITQSGWSSSFSFTTATPPLTGCTNAQYGLFPDQTFTPACTGMVENITNTAYAGEYSNVNIVANRQYAFTSSNTTDFITITNAAGSVIYASGTSPLQWYSSTNSGVIRYYLHTNSACGAEEVVRTRSITCATTSTCNPPSSLASSSINGNSATVSWTASNPIPSNGYQYYISTSNVAPGSTTTPSGNTSGTSVVINGLNSSTLYYVWVRSNCGSSQSSWTSSINFTTTIPTGCTVAENGQFPGQTFTPSCTGSAEVIVNGFASEYSEVNVIADRQYTFSSSNTTDFITITNENATVIYAGGTTPVQWSSGTTAGVVRFYTHSNAACGTDNFARSRSVTCISTANCNPPSALTSSSISVTSADIAWTASSPAPTAGYDVYFSTTNAITPATVPLGTVPGTNAQLTDLTPGTTYYYWVRSNCGASSVSSWVAGSSFTTTTPTGTGCITASFGLYPETTFTPNCSGASQSIVIDAYAGEYSNVNIIANRQYTFTSSVSTDFITISNADASIIYASGNTPLQWNSAANSGIIRYYLHTNSTCGEQEVNRTKSITCTSAAQPCTAPSNVSVSNVLNTTAQLNWNAASPVPASGYQIYYSTSNSVTPSTVPSTSATGLNTQLSNLIPATTYYFWVRSNCGNSNVSAWVSGGSFTTSSGCTSSTYGLLPAATFNPNCTGTSQTILTNAFAGQYSNVIILSNRLYTFTSSVSTDYITITNSTGTIIYASGNTPLQWNSGSNAVVARYYLHTNSMCGEQQTNRTKSMTCPNDCIAPSNLSASNITTISAQLNWNAASPAPFIGYQIYYSTINSVSETTVHTSITPGLTSQLSNLNPGTTYYFWVRSDCGNSRFSDWISGGSFTTTSATGTGCVTASFGLFPTETFVPACSGISETIVTNAYAGEYSNVTILSNKQYTFSSSVTTDFITISNADASVIYASGTSPLLWNSGGNSGIIRYYFHTNNACGEQETNRIRRITCSVAPGPCAVPSNLNSSNVLTTSAQLNWDVASPIPTLGYQIYYSTTNSVTGTTVPSNSTTELNTQLFNLIPATTYYFWVRSNCGNSNVSAWVSGGSFTTTTPTGVGCITATYGLHPTSTYTPNCSGTTNENIVTSAALGGQYSNVNILSNKYYSFSSSVATDFITISNEDATIIYASGPNNLEWYTEANSGVIRFYIHTNSMCGESQINRIKRVLCLDECPMPTNISALDVLSTSALLSWTDNFPFPSGFDIYYSTTNLVTETTVPSTSVGTLSAQLALTNLIPETTYYYWIRSNCGNIGIGEWISGGSFTTTTPLTCASPSNLTVSNLFTTSAQLNWNAATPAPANGYQIYYSTLNSVLPTTTPSNSTTGLSVSVTSLAPSTTYYYWVRSNCGDSNVSAWVSGGSFITATPTGTGCITATFYGLFPTATFTPACSGVSETIVTNAFAGEYSNVNIVANKEYTFTSSVVTDYITISNANATIIYASGVSPLVWNSGTNTGVIRYYFHTNASCGESNANRTRAISCQDSPPTCASPSNLTVTNIASIAARLNWSAASPEPASGYEIYRSTINSISGTTMPTVSINALTVIINDLLPGTTYYFWIRSNCGGTNVSNWIAGPSFTTAVPPGVGCYTASYGFYPPAIFTPACTGQSEIIAPDAKAGEYTFMNIVPDQQYTFTSSVATDYITLTNSNLTVIYASGLSPLVWNSGSNSDLGRYYLHTNAACGESDISRSKFVKCEQPLLDNPNFELTFAKVYPNPTNDFLNIVGESSFDKVIILNNLGQKIKEVNSKLNHIKIDMSTYATGIYYVRVFKENTSKIYKIVRQ